MCLVVPCRPQRTYHLDEQITNLESMELS